MEAAIEEAIHSTVATFVDKAVTGVIENTFAAAVDKAVAERVHAIEDHFAAAVDKAVEDKVKVIEEAMQEKIDRAEKMAKLKANMDAAEKALAERREIRTRFVSKDLDSDLRLSKKDDGDNGILVRSWIKLCLMKGETSKQIMEKIEQSTMQPQV